MAHPLSLSFLIHKRRIVRTTVSVVMLNEIRYDKHPAQNLAPVECPTNVNPLLFQDFPSLCQKFCDFSGQICLYCVLVVETVGNPFTGL